MWKYILCFCLFIALCFMIPSFFIDFSEVNSKQSDIENVKSSEIMENEEKIKLLFSESNEIIELTMNDYIKGVLLRRNASDL